jgi:hypothetical protein
MAEFSGIWRNFQENADLAVFDNGLAQHGVKLL